MFILGATTKQFHALIQILRTNIYIYISHHGIVARLLTAGCLLDLSRAPDVSSQLLKTETV